MDNRKLIKDLELCREELAAKEQMLAMTTSYLLEAQKVVEEKNRILGELNKDLLDSIKFAQLIQDSLAPDNQSLKAFFADAALHIEQREGIGGDSMFSKVVNNGITWGLLDATGHGIPASLLSVSVIFLLSEIAASFYTSDPAEICSAVNNRLHNTFKNHDHSLAHMEGSIFGYDSKDNIITYCSARGKGLLMDKNGKITVIEKENTSIGETSSRIFQKHVLQPAAGDRLFLYSDGLTDQFGGPLNKKFGRTNLYSLITGKRASPAEELKDAIITAHSQWRQHYPQTDDLSFIIIDF